MSFDPATLLLSQHRPDDCVAFGLDGERSAQQLVQDAARIAAALPPPQPGSHVLLRFEQDRYAMAAALLGSWAKGHALALAPNGRRDTVLAVRHRPAVIAMVHDCDGWGAALATTDLLAMPQPPHPARWPWRLQNHASRPHLATLFSSGSTAAITAYRKSTAALLGEAHMLGAHFRMPHGSKVVASVPPGHLYGLLFSVLVPLCTGGAFWRPICTPPAEAAMAVATYQAAALVTVPMHLRGLNRSNTPALTSLQHVFSAAAPLSLTTAQAFVRSHQVPITDILGSTETGGMAWRRFTATTTTPPLFSALPGVTLHSHAAAQLRVDSPYLSDDLPRPWLSADQVRMHSDGRFVHLGRHDDIVKVSGRRVSLTAIAAKLRELPSIADATVLALPQPQDHNPLLLAAVVPKTHTQDGPPQWQQALAASFDPGCLPKHFVTTAALPRQENGKLMRQEVLALFSVEYLAP